MVRESNIRIAIVRPLATPLDRRFYNSQELGLGSALTRHRCDVDVFAVGANEVVVTEEIETEGGGTLRLHECPFRRAPDVAQALMPAMRSRLWAEQFDFIQVNESNELESWLVARGARKRNIPLAVYQGMYQPISGRVQRLFQTVYNRMMLPTLRKAACAALAKTNRAAQFLQQRGFGNVRVLPVGLDPQPFEQHESIDWRTQLGIPAGHKILTYVGVIEARRKPDLLAQIADGLRDEPVSMIIAGTGPLEAQLRAEVERQSLQNVHLVGRLAQGRLPSLYEQSEFLLLPSTYEIYGMVVLEAMYFGLPVISNRTAGPESIIASHVDGLLLPNLSPDTWLDAIRVQLNNPSRRRNMSAAAQTKIHTTLTWDHIARTYLEDVIRPAVAAAN